MVARRYRSQGETNRWLISSAAIAKFDPSVAKAQRDQAFKVLRWYAGRARDIALLEADGIEPVRELVNTE